jgi:methanogenic corrinoid protein MtbC1
VIYLGADLPSEHIADAAARIGASAVGISAVVHDRKRIAILRNLEKLLSPEVTLLVGGAAAKQLSDAMGRTAAVFIENMSALHGQLAQLRTRRNGSYK